MPNNTSNFASLGRLPVVDGLYNLRRNADETVNWQETVNTPVVDNLTSTLTTSALSANQGRVIKNSTIFEWDATLQYEDLALVLFEDGIYRCTYIIESSEYVAGTTFFELRDLNGVDESYVIRRDNTVIAAGGISSLIPIAGGHYEFNEGNMRYRSVGTVQSTVIDAVLSRTSRLGCSNLLGVMPDDSPSSDPTHWKLCDYSQMQLITCYRGEHCWSSHQCCWPCYQR